MPGIIRTEHPPIDRGVATATVPAGQRRARQGLFQLNGEPARCTRRPIGTATLVRFTNNQKWFEGSALYWLDPPIQIFEYGTMTEAVYVIVANVPAGDGHDCATSVFAASGHGTLFGRFADLDDYRSAEVGPRLVGKYDHRRVLGALQGGYATENGLVESGRRRSRTNRSRKPKPKA